MPLARYLRGPGVRALALAVVGLICALALAPAWSADISSYRTLEELQSAMRRGDLTSVALVRHDLARIAALDRRGPKLHAIIAINPDALLQARSLDRERRDRGPRGPLHGIPILIKDNIETRDRMPTTAGSLALVHNFAERDAPVVAALRAAGAVILGKTNLSEWANFRSSRSVSGWSAVGGLTRNPYVLDRTACGSSSGSAVAVAAGMAAASIGTETDGSITCPASMNGLVGLKPTHGLIARPGIVPVAASQDTAGPMGRSVADVAQLLDVMVSGRGSRTVASARASYTTALIGTALAGKRIGVLRFDPPAQSLLADVYEEALRRLTAGGAVLIDVERPDMLPIEAAERLVLLTEFKSDLDEYLSHTPRSVGVRGLAQLIAFDLRSTDEMTLFGQDIFLQAEEGTAGLADPAYQRALADGRRLAGPDGIDRLLREHRLDLLVAPTTAPAWRIDSLLGDRDTPTFTTLAAVSGDPHLTVPMGEVRGLPVGLSFIGPAWSERLLLACGFAFERRSPRLPPPRFRSSLDAGAE
ncbi:MAG: amidase [Steroidobacteraceae bacterium]